MTPAAKLDVLYRVLFGSLIAGLYFTHLLIQAAATLAVTLLVVDLVRRRPLRCHPLGRIVLAWFVSGVVALVISGQPLARVPALLPHFVLLSLIPLSAWSRGRPPLDTARWMLAIVIAASLAAFAGAYHHFGGAERARGFYGGYYGLAAAMAGSIPISAGLMLSKRARWMWILIPLVLVQLAALWWTYTRSAFIGLFLAMFIWAASRVLGAIKRGRSGARGPVRAASLLAIPLVLLVLVWRSPDPRLNPMRASVTSAAAPARDLTSGRAEIIADAVRIVSGDRGAAAALHALLGFGLSSRQRLVESKFTSWESDLLQAYMNQGLVGLAVIIASYGCLLGLAAGGMRAEDPLANGLAASVIVATAMGLLSVQLTAHIAAAGFIVLFVLLDSRLRPDDVARGLERGRLSSGRCRDRLRARRGG